ncbi:flavin-containing monooxygenase [Nocardia lijiangensis]|uniref:flavin-containing monooxygenase n=1 Tax=Nocardia lijiangensis TaxID=299618 RepID=UPI003D748642
MTRTTEPNPTPAAGTGPRQRADAWLRDFETALAAGDAHTVAAMFSVDGLWRDLVAFTWNIKTLEGRVEIADMVRTQVADIRPRSFHTTDAATESEGVITAPIGFDTAVGSGIGLLRLTDAGAFTLLTTLHELHGRPEPVGAQRPKGVAHGAIRRRVGSAEELEREERELDRTRQPYVVVVGGGQAGIVLGARLRQLGVPALVVDENDRPGDRWRTRYKSLALHDPVWYDHLPYLPFPDHWPVFTPKDKLADWLEFYTRVMEVPYWSKTTCVRASYDERRRQWDVHVRRDGESLVLTPRHLVLATGMSGKPNIPNIPGANRFRGEQQHSSRHPGPDAYAGKRAVVIGSGNSAHDICAALWEAGARVTMVQRSSTHVVRSESAIEFALGELYSEQAVANGITTEKADLMFASLPYRLLPSLQAPIYAAIRERDAEFYARLKRAGFQLDWGDDDSGLFLKYLRGGSGYYIDTGASELIANGDIRLAHGEVRELTEDTVVLGDGTALPADLVVYATGYAPMHRWVTDLIGPGTAETVGRCWGYGSGTTKDPGPWEGELRNMWKPTEQDGLWFHGGNLHQTRFYSRYLALQLAAHYTGIPTPVYGLQQVHHRT